MKKDSKKSARRAPGRPASLEPVERTMVATRLDPGIYRQLVAAAEANRNSLSAEAERRIEKSFGPTQVSSFYESYGALVMTAFDMGGRLAAGPERPLEEWIKDPAICERAVSLAIQALLSWLPKPLCDLHDAAGNPIKVLSARTTLSANPADEGRLVFTTPDEIANEKKD
jgi:hypothetical protein